MLFVFLGGILLIDESINQTPPQKKKMNKNLSVYFIMYVLCKIIFVLSRLVFPTALIGLFCQIQDSAINSAFRTLLCR